MGRFGEMQRHKVIKTDKGRVTIQTNAYGSPEIKVRIDGETYHVGCEYETIKRIEKVVDALLNSSPVVNE